jgi:hypothetical protein
MKNILLVLFLFFCHFAQAQVNVAGVNINDLEDVNYVRVEVSPRLILNRTDVSVDYGQERGSFFLRQVISDNNGNIIEFRSNVQVINFMDNNGWDYVNEQVIRAEESYNIYHYLFKKETTN